MENAIKPNWLETLEKQSWQTELIASGLAIYGSISIGPLINEAAVVSSTIFPDRVLNVLMWMFMYFHLVQAILVFAFILHLIMRIVWAGIIGLSSVYPNGINIENKTYPKHFLEKIKNEFPNLSEYSIEIDKICSRVFANLCFIIFLFLSISIWILIIACISELYYYVFEVEILKYILITVAAIYIVIALLSYLFMIGPKKESSFAKKYTYKYNRVFSKVLLFGFYKPASHIMWTQRTNQTTQQFLLGFILLLPISFYSGIKTGKVISQLEPTEYFQLNSIAYDADASNYLDTNGDSRIIRPLIQSRLISKNYIELFIPELKREELHKIQICGEDTAKVDKTVLKNRIDQSKFKEECAKKYYSISINNDEDTTTKYEFRKHPLNGEKGFLTYLNVQNLNNGQHLLKISTGYKNTEGEFATRVIPFFKVE